MSRTTVVYLSGFGRSGSTLVERMLGAATAWVNVGELVDLARSVAPADELCGCGEPFSRCPVWTRVGEAAFGGWTADVLDRLALVQRSAARQRHLPGLLAARRPASGALLELQNGYAAIYRAVAEVTGSSVVVDASKGPALGAALAGAADVDLRMLNVVRDPRAVAWSWRRHVDRPHATSGAGQMWRIPVHRSAAQWSALQLEVEAVAYAGRAPVARIRYEDLVEDPVRTLATATAKLDLPLGPVDLPGAGGEVVLQPSHGLSGNPGRFRSGTVPLRRDDRWVTEMPASSRALVTALTLPLLATYRYPLGTHTTVPAVALEDRLSRSSS
jgi:Sulfotransferase family